MQTALCRIWTQVGRSISYENNHYTMCASTLNVYHLPCKNKNKKNYIDNSTVYIYKNKGTMFIM